jgi:hypothetical protein
MNIWDADLIVGNNTWWDKRKVFQLTIQTGELLNVK